MWKTATSVLTGLLTASLAVACASELTPTAPDHGKRQPVSKPDPVTPREFTLETAVAAARSDAARHTGVAADLLVLISADHVTWPDGSMGCPQNGMLYTQALIPGFRIRLRGPAGELDYHASTRGGMLLCPAGRATDQAAPGGFGSRI